MCLMIDEVILSASEVCCDFDRCVGGAEEILLRLSLFVGLPWMHCTVAAAVFRRG